MSAALQTTSIGIIAALTFKPVQIAKVRRSNTAASWVMREAWKSYRAQCEGIEGPFRPRLFTRHLESAWTLWRIMNARRVLSAGQVSITTAQSIEIGRD